MSNLKLSNEIDLPAIGETMQLGDELELPESQVQGKRRVTPRGPGDLGNLEVLPSQRKDIFTESLVESADRVEANLQDMFSNPQLYRDAGEMGGSIAGGIIGTGLAGPAGTVSGSAAGGAFGRMTISSLQNTFGLSEGDAQKVRDEVMTSAKGELLVSSVIEAFGRGYFTKKLGKLFGLDKPDSWRRAMAGVRQGIKLGAADVGGRLPRGLKSVVSVFPYAAGPAIKATARSADQIQEAVYRELHALAPMGTFADMGVEIKRVADKRYHKFTRIAKKFYQRAWDTADSITGGAPIIPTGTIRGAVSGIRSDLRMKPVTTASGKATTDTRFSNAVLEFLDDAEDLNPNMTYEELRTYKDQIAGLFDAGETTQRDKVILTQLADAADASLFLAPLPSGDATKITNAFAEANDFYAKWQKVFNSPSARRLKDVDKNIFAAGAEKLGTVEADELLQKVVRTNSGDAIDNLYGMVGKRTGDKTIRTWISGAFEDALTDVPGQDVYDFDPSVVRKALSFDKARSKGFHSAIKDNSDVDMDAINDILTAAESLGPIKLPSTFVARRAVMGGLKSALMAMTAGQGLQTADTLTGGIANMATAMFGLRWISDKITNPQVVASMHTIMLNPHLIKTDPRLYEEAALRVLRFFELNDQEADDVPSFN